MNYKKLTDLEKERVLNEVKDYQILIEKKKLSEIKNPSNTKKQGKRET